MGTPDLQTHRPGPVCGVASWQCAGAILAAVLTVTACASPQASPPHPVDPRPGLLAALDGEWVMTGDVLGESVVYDLDAGPVLGGAFTELHLLDRQRPPQYEARVFLGHDAESDTLIAHWLDSFGARASIPHGTGHVTEDTIEFIVPYPDGSFRDTLRFDPLTGLWSFEVEAQQPSGDWAHFARYEMRRK